MTQDISILFVQENTPSGNIQSDPERGNAIWIKASTGEVREWNAAMSQWDLCPVPPHSHATHGDINFTGTVSVDGVPGITGEYEGTFKKIKVQDGIIVDFELE